MAEVNDNVALIDLDGTVADYDRHMVSEMRALQAPGEVPFGDRYGENGQREEKPYEEFRRKLIQRQPGFWRNLPRLETGFEVVTLLKEIGFELHVLTKGPRHSPAAWGEKLEWAQIHLPDAAVTVAGDKSLVYGKVLVDDFPPYFEAWLAVRPRGKVICVAQPWNKEYGAGGSKFNVNVYRYPPGNQPERMSLYEFVRAAYDRKGGQP